jgi:hypothetical protein
LQWRSLRSFIYYHFLSAKKTRENIALSNFDLQPQVAVNVMRMGAALHPAIVEQPTKDRCRNSSAEKRVTKQGVETSI